ncbi:DENN domain-containing protein 5A [Morella rubra]|uniref:DENN domain-containing protein 5A n=1 Tax=Morella rubra TaxID=262757 RepID=A0A6A1V9R4_9ROSI|nr:DENN domain-containing protein 5A [Morella rubra]KAB1209477.1 DENN domain-containing protein 5A [Morella rubra]
MADNEETGSPSWGASFFMQTKEDVARAVAAAAAAATAAHSPRPSVVFSSKDDSGGSPIKKIQRQVSRALKGLSQPPEVKSSTYNPEVLTSQKRQWASCQLQYLDHRSLKEPTRLFESMVVVGLHPDCDIQALNRQYIARKSEGSGRLRTALGSQNQCRVEPNVEPQVLFVYPPEKELPLKYKDLLSFCFPGGVEVHAIERTPSMSEFNEILLGQEHLKQSDLSFVFRLQVADDSTMYGCCVLVEELVQKPSGLLSLISDQQSSCPSLSRHMLTTRRCYCILSRLPFFELHFGVLNSIFTEERLERLQKDMVLLNLESPEEYGKEERLEENIDENSDVVSLNHRAAEDLLKGTAEISELSLRKCKPGKSTANGSHEERNGNFCLLKEGVNHNIVVPIDPDPERLTAKRESTSANSEDSDVNAYDCLATKQVGERRLPNAVLPLMRYCQYESSESSSSFQGSPSEDRNFRSDVDDTETEETSFSGQEDSNDLLDILEWAKANKRGSLQIICEYYRLHCPARGSTVSFHPLEHLHPLEYHRPDETVLHIAGSTIDLRSCSSSLEFAEAHSALLVEEEATALSVWAVACICGCLRLENVLALFAGALLEKQIVFVCSNLGILSASVLSIIPLIRPYQWQSLLMPVLPNDMLDFLDAPVPYIVGVKNRTNEVQSKLTNAILVDINKNQVKSSSIPQLPQQKELLSSLSPYHAKLVGESYLGRKRPVYDCTDVQVEAAKSFLAVLRSYLDSLCSKLRSHTITNVQSNDDKVCILLK